MISPAIKTLTEKKLIGKRLKMSLSVNKTVHLWQSFMPRRSEIKNNIGTVFYSLQNYDTIYFTNFNQDKEFEKWAAIEVTNFDTVPFGMETLTLTGGLYAVFLYKGAASNGPQTFQYIFGTWLPNSEYLLDSRPHFEVLGDKYKNDSPDSEEEIWIPIKQKK